MNKKIIKVKCFNNEYFEDFLSNGKIYNAVSATGNSLVLLYIHSCDNDKSGYFGGYRFEIIDDSEHKN